MRSGVQSAAVASHRQSGFFFQLLALSIFFTLAFLIANARAQSIDPSLIQQYMQQKGGTITGVTGSPLDQAREQAQQQRDQMEQRGALQDNGMRLGMAEEPSRLEQDYQTRTKSEITQFGYDIFTGHQGSSDIVTGRIPDRYVLGVGDELVVTFQGQSPKTITTYVDREGRIILPGLRPINAAGRSFGDFRADLESVTKSSLIGTEVYVSLGSVRMISVYIVGEVAKPGLYRLTSLMTTLEALNAAGGVEKSGSLRRIRVEHSGKVVPVDLYQLLAGDHTSDISLHDGDRIVVPPIGPTAAITGDVVRPAIYELPGQTGLSLENLLKLAGGTLRPRGYAFVLNRMDQLGRQKLTTIDAKKAHIQPGDIVAVGLRENGQVGGVTLAGAVRAPGVRSLDEAPTLRKLIGDVHNLGDTPYLLFGAIQRIDPDTRAKVLQPFSPERVLSGAEDVALKDGDKVVILDQRDISFLSSGYVRSVVSGAEPDAECKALDELARIVNDSQSNRFAAAIRIIMTHGAGVSQQMRQAQGASDLQGGQDSGQTSEQHRALSGGDYNQSDMQRSPMSNAAYGQQQASGYNQVGRQQEALPGGAYGQPAYARTEGRYGAAPAAFVDTYNPACPSVFEKTRHLLPFALEYVVSVDGALRVPGIYPVAEKTSLASLAAAAGGSVYNADLSNIEVLNFATPDKGHDSTLARHHIDGAHTNLASIFVGPGSGVRINTLFSNLEAGGVVISGEVRSPGVYSIRRGETLSELLKRAGGLTNQAYPYGAVFTRVRVKQAEEQELKRAAQQLNSAMASALLSKRDIKPEAAAAVESLSQKISAAEVVGRVVVEADPTVLREKPQLDTVLEPGDRIFLPKRPNYVLLIGDVLNPTALQFAPGKKVGQYLREAGGVQSTADKGRIFVVYPNGKAQPVHTSMWGFGSGAAIPPGSAIVIPKDPMPFDGMSFMKDITQILSQLAISAASIVVIGR